MFSLLAKLIGFTNHEPTVAEQMFRNPYPAAKIHNVLCSDRGDFFRLKLLSYLQKECNEKDLLTFRNEVGLEEYARHIHKLMEVGLVEEMKTPQGRVYLRTTNGEQALNAVRELERNIGKEEARQIFRGNFRHNSIRLFLLLYRQNTSPVTVNSHSGKTKLAVRYNPQQIAKITRHFQRSIDGIAAIDKLDTAKLLEHRNDGYIYFHAKKARAFYIYLKKLFFIANMIGLEKNSEGNGTA